MTKPSIFNIGHSKIFKNTLCDFCGSKHLFYEVECTLTWALRFEKHFVHRLPTEMFDKRICVNCKTEFLNDFNTFNFKYQMGLL